MSDSFGVHLWFSLRYCYSHGKTIRILCPPSKRTYMYILHVHAIKITYLLLYHRAYKQGVDMASVQGPAARSQGRRRHVRFH